MNLHTKKQNNYPIDVGPAMRMRRRQLDLKLKDVGLKTGLSVGFLSQVERNITTPSLSSLVTIANALEVGIDYFITPPDGAGLVTREKNRDYFSVKGSHLRYSRLNREFPGGLLNCVISRMPPGYVSEVTRHDGEDFIYVIKGEGFVRVGDEQYEMSTGDSIHFTATMPHQWGNRGDIECIWLFVGTMPLFRKSKNGIDK